MRKAGISVGRIVNAIHVGVDHVEAEGDQTVAGVEYGNVVDLRPSVRGRKRKYKEEEEEKVRKEGGKEEVVK